MQRVQNATASFVRLSYSTTSDVLAIKWLPMKERSEFSLAKLAYKSLNNGNWPKYLPLERNSLKLRELRANRDTSTIRCNKNIPSTFEYDASKVFNDLPLACRINEKYSSFCTLTKKYLVDKAMARITSFS